MRFMPVISSVSRPLTNVIWSDTVALMKIVLRPLEILVARELSERPSSVEEEEFVKVGQRHGGFGGGIIERIRMAIK